jgi:hypothetical protein
MTIKIVSGGKGINTRVELEDGTILDNVYYAQWECDAQGCANVALKFRNVPVEIQGDMDEVEFNAKYRIEDITAFGDDAVKRAIVKRVDD